MLKTFGGSRRLSRALHGLNAAHHPLRARVPHEASRNAIGPERSGETPNAGERLKGVWTGSAVGGTQRTRINRARSNTWAVSPGHTIQIKKRQKIPFAES